MSILNSHSILSDAARTVRQFAQTHGATADALAKSEVDDTCLLWKDACEHLLTWRSNPETFDSEDRPAIEILDTAIDYAVDQLQNAGKKSQIGAAPTVIIPSGDGKVAFEWHHLKGAMVIEFVGRGRAKYTVFVGGRVVDKGLLERNPQTRQLERGE